MPCTDGGPSYSQLQHLDDPARELNEVKREFDALKVRADEATALLCQYGPMIPEAKRTLQLKTSLGCVMAIIMADNGRFIKTSDPLSLMSSFYVESRKQ